MKNLKYLVIFSILFGFLSSCSEKDNFDQIASQAMLKGKKIEITEKIPSLPVSDFEIPAFIIPGENKGGNRTCAEVALAFGKGSDYFSLCGERIDYDEYYGFRGEFPDGLNVTTDGTYVSFESDGCIKIGDSSYRVGAVIVKGSDNANVYFYPDGTNGDYGLAAPLNSSGSSSGLSNLTFCFVECSDITEIVLALKTYITIPGEVEYAWAVSGGEEADGNSLMMGYNIYMSGIESVMPLNYKGYSDIGTISVSDYYEEGVHILEIILDTYDDDWLFKDSFIYAGSIEGFKSYCTTGDDGLVYTKYSAFPFSSDILSGKRIFKIPYSQITE